MAEAWEFISRLFNPESIILYGGIALLLAVVFAETGLFFGFFLPGDSLLFTAGLLCGTDVLHVHIVTLLLTVTGAGVLGIIPGSMATPARSTHASVIHARRVRHQPLPSPMPTRHVAPPRPVLARPVLARPPPPRPALARPPAKPCNLWRFHALPVWIRHRFGGACWATANPCSLWRFHALPVWMRHKLWRGALVDRP